jgi:saccharopine dehydrogenase-like NADP-dependent oxidoreductase
MIRAKSAGILLLNEVGLDPGLDHMSAMKLIHDIQDRGGTVTSFSSVCGGLPAPEAADNPLKYKFSWSPRGVISASQNSAQYRWEDHVVQVSGRDHPGIWMLDRDPSSLTLILPCIVRVRSTE